MNIRNILVIAISILLVACNQTQQETTAQNKDFNKVLERYYEDGLKLYPLNATFAGDNRYNSSFPNTLSTAFKTKLKKYYQSCLKQADQFGDSDLSESEQLSKSVLQWECSTSLEGLKFSQDLTPIDQMWSVNLMVGQLASGSSAQPFETVEDYDAWLSRVDGYLQWMASAQDKMQQGIKQGVVLPKSLITKVLPQFKSLAEGKVEDHLFYSPVNNFPDTISKDDQARLKQQYTQAVADKIMPSYQKIYNFMNGDYMKAGRDSSGIQAIPNGDEFYQYQIKLYTTTDMTAGEIHQLGLDEVARIRSEMEKIKKQVGYKGDLKSFFNYVRNNPKLMPFTDPQQVIDNFNEIHQRMKPQIEKLFGNKPKTPFEVRRTEAFREKSASAEYNPGSLDGTRPGIFYTPIPNAKKYNMYSDESLFLHEAIPGHHYQISLTQESKVLPTFRKTLWYSGYGEGWALYSESLGRELGLYTDPYQYFGMLGAEMHRAIRLVVDTGLHYKAWTREQAIQYSLDNEAEPEASIISEIERYMANPGQALAYKIGQLTILRLREKAEKALGKQFDIREFHNQVLETGAIPLALLEAKIDKWIVEQK